MGFKKFESLAEDDKDLERLATEDPDDFMYDGIAGTQTQEERKRKKDGIKAKKVSVSLPEDMYAKVCAAARIQNMNVSKTIQAALKNYLALPRVKEYVKQFEGAQAAADEYLKTIKSRKS